MYHCSSTLVSSTGPRLSSPPRKGPGDEAGSTLPSTMDPLTSFAPQWKPPDVIKGRVSRPHGKRHQNQENGECQRQQKPRLKQEVGEKGDTPVDLSGVGPIAVLGRERQTSVWRGGGCERHKVTFCIAPRA